MTTKTATTKTQQRAICPACFAQQAIRKSGTLVPHGYTRPQHWHQNVGTCSGAGHMHFGTERGRDYTRSLADRLRNIAAASDVTAAEVLAGTSPVMGRKRLSGGRVAMAVVLDNPTTDDRKRYAAGLAQQAQQLRQQAVELDAAVAAWTPVAPVTVAVEAKQPLLHLRGGFYGG